MPRSKLKKNKEYERQQKAAKAAAKKLDAIDEESTLEQLAQKYSDELKEKLKHSGHHCRLKDRGKTHYPRESCLTHHHMGWCPNCAYLCGADYGCQDCRAKKDELCYSTAAFAWFLAKKEYDEKYGNTAADNGGNGVAALDG